MSRRAILTPQVLAGIPALIEQGLRKGDIAERLGCKESTLQVQCSIAGISLRGRKRMELRVGSPLTLSHEALVGLSARCLHRPQRDAARQRTSRSNCTR